MRPEPASPGPDHPGAGAIPDGHLWHPFADMHAIAGHELVLERGEGAWVWSVDGTRYLDASAGLWYCNVGHGRERLATVAAEQMRTLAGYQLFDRLTNRPALELADRLCELAPPSASAAAFFTNGGSDAVDSAIKIARRFWQVRGQSERQIIVARDGAYHGVNGYGTGLSGIEPNATGWGQLAGGVLHVPRHDIAALAELLESHRGRVAAFIGEPVQGAAGVHPPAAGYWEAVQDLCAEHELLLIADEVITGFGRVGRWFASERYEIAPDLLLGAKGLSSGYLPIGVVMIGERVRDVLWSAHAGVFRHGYTYSGHPAACAVALENLRIIDQERLVERVAELEPVLSRELAPLAAHPLVGEIRTAGLLAAVELTEAARAARPGVTEEVVAVARERGVLVRNLLGRALQISPPFVIEPEELALLAETLADALDAVRSQMTAS